MILAFVALAIVLLVGYIWMIRGFFSAFLHMICVFAAASIAFGVWELVAYALLDQGGVLENSAWALGLALPFALALVPIRIAFDKLVPSNVKVLPVVDYVGGGICGVASGLVTAGMIVLSLGMLRLDAEFLGYRALEYNSTGNIVRTGGLLLPADKIVEHVFQYTSQRVFSTESPLAKLYPDLSELPSSLRMTFGEGKNRNTIRPGDFEVTGRYTVGRGKKIKARDLARDKWGPAPSQEPELPDRTRVADGSYLDGYLIKFTAGAKDRGDGKVVVGAGQMRLIVRDAQDYEYLTLYPIAAVCQAEAATPQLARFRYDGREVFLASAGGAAEAVFAFEFPVPDGYEPVALYVKNVRHMVTDSEGVAMKANLGEFSSPTERDAAISSNRFLRGDAAGGIKDQTPLDTTKEAKIGDGRTPPPGQPPVIPGLRVSNRLVSNLQKGTEMGLVIDESNVIIDGSAWISKETVSKSAGVDKALRIEKFATSADTLIVQVEVHTGPFSLLGNVAAQVDNKLAPMLRDTNDTSYLPIGWIYNDDTNYNFRYTPGEPITSVDMLGREKVGLSRSRTDQKLVLIYRVSRGVTLNRFTIGNVSVCVFDPVLPLTMEQR